MKKSNCCKICGRSDFEDKGDHLLCRVCGEKQKKYNVSKLQFFSIPVLILLGINCEIIADLIGVYKVDVYDPDFKSHEFLGMIRYKFTQVLTCRHNTYNELDLLMIDLRHHLSWLAPLFTLIGIALFGLALYFIVTIYNDMKKIAISNREK